MRTLICGRLDVDQRCFERCEENISSVGRVQDNTVIDVAEDRPLTAAAQAAGAVPDAEIQQSGARAQVANATGCSSIYISIQGIS